jgi:hypothetical protein
MIKCKDEFEGQVEPKRTANQLADEDLKVHPPGEIRMVSQFDFRSPAERGLIPYYVLTQMPHRRGELAADVDSKERDRTADLSDGKAGRPPHPISATSGKPFGPAVQRVSDSILHRYHKAVDSLWRRIVAEDRGSHMYRVVGPLEIVDLLLRRAPEMRPSTWNTTRAAVLYWLEGLPQNEDVMQSRVILLTGCPKDGFKGPKPGTTATRYSSKSQRKRTFSKREFDRLLRYLDKRALDSQRTLSPGALVGAWLRAGLASGLRPVEWEHAAWADDSKSKLRVKTAKQRQRKADWTAGIARLEIDPGPEVAEELQPPKYRLVSIDEPDREAVGEFMTMLHSLLEEGEQYQDIYNRVRKYLWNSSLAVFGQEGSRFSLYLMRGQFGSNRKARQGTAATAGEMGNSPLKASGYYGKVIHAHRAGGSGGQKPAEGLKDFHNEPASREKADRAK